MALIETLTDDFNDNVRNTGVWAVNVTATTVAETGGQLVITLASNNPVYSGYVSVSTYDLTGSQLSIQCIQAVNPLSGCEQYMAAFLDASNEMDIYIGAGNLIFRMRVAGVNNDIGVAFDPVAMLWWRLRELAGTIYWETSDGNSWVVQRSAPTPFAITNLSVNLTAGTYQNVATPGVAIFDNCNILKTAITGWLRA